MDDLNRHQIILLCILISFVVSIATGIMTTSLLMQAPVELTKTVNQVVEKTIQTVVPATDGLAGKPGQTTTTVVVNEDDSVTSAIAKNSTSIVRIHAKSSDGSVDNFYGMGIILSASGIIVSDKQQISSAMNYVAITSNNTEIPLVPIAPQSGWQVGFFQAKAPAGTSYVFTPAGLAGADLQLGQTVITIGGNQSNAIGVGRVTHISTQTTAVSGTTTPAHYVSSVETDIAPTDEVAGAPILSLSGDIVGMSLSSFSSSKSYLPSAIISQEFKTIQIAQ